MLGFLCLLVFVLSYSFNYLCGLFWSSPAGIRQRAGGGSDGPERRGGSGLLAWDVTAAPKKNSFLAGGDIHCFGNELAAGWGRALEDQKVMSRGRGATSFE